MKEKVKIRLETIDKILSDEFSFKELADVLGKKDVVYSREYATTPDMNCPTCGRVLLTNYPRFCSDCGTRLHYKYNEED